METRLFLDWMNLGYGYDLLAGEMRETAIILKEPKKVQEDFEENRILEAEEFSSYKNLISILNTRSISIESLREWAYGKGFGVDAGIITFLYSFSINPYSIFLLIKSVVKLNNISMEGKEITLSKEATEFLKNSDPKEFLGRYGDEFIVGITNGGIYLGILEITTKTKEERQEIISQLKIDFHKKLELSNIVTVLSNIDRNKIRISTFQRGGDRILGVTKIAELVDTLEKFSNSVNEENALPLFVTTMPYGELVAENEKHPPYPGLHYHGILKPAHECAETHDELSSAQYVVDHQDEFIVSDKEMFVRISRRRDEAKSFLKKQYEQAHNLFSGKGGSFSGGYSVGVLPERK